MKRSLSRQNAFIICFEINFNNEDVDFLIDYAKEHLDMEFDKFSLSLIKISISNKEEISRIIEKNLKNWRLNRIPKTALTMLTLAITEILYFNKIPYKVTANEYIELAKSFVYEEEVSFINGVIGSVLKDR
ncbi:MAG: transcription antitermination factor NusB [Oscillospiraceae bacterium]